MSGHRSSNIPLILPGIRFVTNGAECRIEYRILPPTFTIVCIGIMGVAFLSFIWFIFPQIARQSSRPDLIMLARSWAPVGIPLIAVLFLVLCTLQQLYLRRRGPILTMDVESGSIDLRHTTMKLNVRDVQRCEFRLYSTASLIWLDVVLVARASQEPELAGCEWPVGKWNGSRVEAPAVFGKWARLAGVECVTVRTPNESHSGLDRDVRR